MKLHSPVPPQFELEKIDFPTDRITVGELRRRQPRIFNFLTHHSEHIDNVLLAGTMAVEQELAFKAFARAAGLPNPDLDPFTSASELMRMLDRDYRRHGISMGNQQTKQMVRTFEKAAAAQGRASRGASR